MSNNLTPRLLWRIYSSRRHGIVVSSLCSFVDQANQRACVVGHIMFPPVLIKTVIQVVIMCFRRCLERRRTGWQWRGETAQRRENFE
jgi:hypothetical protein